MSLLNHWNSKEFAKMRFDAVGMEWTDLDDFSQKYNFRNNVDVYASQMTFGRSLLGLAELKRKGLIDLDFLDGMMTTDALNWWARFGALERERWKRGRPGWHSLVPFVMEVIEYSKIKRPWEFDENGDYKSSSARGQPWVKPEEMRQLMRELNIK